MNTKKNIRLLSILFALLLAMSMTLMACDDANTPIESGSESDSESASVSETQSDTETESESESDASTITYTVNVVDESGAPLANVLVQVCIDAPDGTCGLPMYTDENGVCVFDRDAETAYKVAVQMAGYTTAEDYYRFDQGTAEMTIAMTTVSAENV